MNFCSMLADNYIAANDSLAAVFLNSKPLPLAVAAVAG
jgi:hypothetical protein